MAEFASRRVVVAGDTSSLQRHLAGIEGADTLALSTALDKRLLVLPPVVLAEALSDGALSNANSEKMRSIPLLEIEAGYWERAGMMRAVLRSEGFKANLAVCLIAQSCIDHDIPLITYDRDFRHFGRAGLRLA
jgi:predicted nucleic acid-binding protein